MSRTCVVLSLLLAACGEPRPRASLPAPASSASSSRASLRPAPSAPPSVAAPPASEAETTPPPAPLSPVSPPAPPPELVTSGGPGSVRGERGVVTSSEAAATRAGVSILERGGNAIDAAIATALALAVTHPSAGNLGGGGFLLVRPNGGPTTALDFREVAPAALDRARYQAVNRSPDPQAAASGVPGTVAGLLLAHERFGRLPRAEVFAPAIALARDGFRLARRPAALLAGSFPKITDPLLRTRFGNAGKPRTAGERVRLPELAQTLQRIAQEGRDGFYEGAVAEAITRAPGSLITRDDLRAYQPVLREPLRTTYRGFTVETMPPPSAGGVALVEMLAMLQVLEPEGAPADGALAAHHFLEASRRAQAERRYGVVDPSVWSAEELRERMQRWSSGAELLTRAPVNPDRVTPSRELAPAFLPTEPESAETTHLSVSDSEGTVVSLTTTLSASFGAKVTAPGTGVVLNNSAASFSLQGENQPAPGRRTTSSMAPTLVLSGERVVLVLGTPGGDTIPGTIAQVLRHVIDERLSLAAAITAPRLHHGFLPDVARYESQRPPLPAILSGLRARGHELRGSHLAMGDANDLLLQDGATWAFADPRGGGLAAAVP